MHRPPAFAQDDRETLAAPIAAPALATLVAHTAPGPGAEPGAAARATRVRGR